MKARWLLRGHIREGEKKKAEKMRGEISRPEERERKHEKDMRREKTEYRG